MKKLILTILLVFLIVFLCKDSIYNFEYNSTAIGPDQTAERARILEIQPKENGENLKIQILTGDLKDKLFMIENNYYNTDYYVRPFRVNNKIIVEVDRSENQQDPGITILNYARDIFSLYLVFIFLSFLILIGKKQGFKSAISLFLTILIIIKVMIPFILKGYNPILSAIVCCFIISILNLITITGISLKSIATLIGTSLGVIVAGLLSYWVGILSHFSGLSDEDSLLLINVNQGSIDLNGILFAGIIIGTLGAVMDMSMSISSSMYEIMQNNPDINKTKLIKSGLSIGKDVMGTMANTLILAYAGTAIPLLLFSITKQTPLIILFNSETISAEILRALSGSIGIILSIPATAFAFVLTIHKKQYTGIAIENVNFRSSPEISDNIVGKLIYREHLFIIDHDKNWYKVKRKKGETGWIREDGLSIKRRFLSSDTHDE